ncbi:glycosyltransferase [Alicyclobacillus herbarius]|uniref:glycosyltransferase n=1 Tax=Alicyclobacillus herbarius TaxID=122960 RepID=UPI0023527DE7|nr:glycosyltransferase [Alicyclobacillus herbarius]
MSVWVWVLTLVLVAWLYLLLAHGGYWRADVELPSQNDPFGRASPRRASRAVADDSLADDSAAEYPVADYRVTHYRAADYPAEGHPAEDYPSVCVIVPARNEADILPRSLPALLQQDYPGPLRVLLVDDQSEDGTAKVAMEAAAACGRSTRLTILRADRLPKGWAGKVWAMQQGFLASTPQDTFLLFTDADIWHPKASVRALVDKARMDKLDLVSRMVRLRTDTFWEKLLIPAFVLFFAKLYPFRRVNNPDARTAAAAGGCILVRRACLAETGLEPIRGALIDDCALARYVKRRGGRIWLGLGPDVLSLRAYPRLRDIWRMVARSAFVQLRYSGLLLLGTVCGMVFLYLLAPVSLLVAALEVGAGGGGAGQAVWALVLAAAATLLMSVSFSPMLRWYGVSCAFAPLLPLAAFLYTAMTVDSARRFWFGGRDMWKGRPFVRQA